MKGKFLLFIRLVPLTMYLTMGLMAEDLLNKDDPHYTPREIPAREIPDPQDVSPQLQEEIAQPLDPLWKKQPKTLAEWHSIIDRADIIITERLLKSANALFTVDIEASTLNGIPVYTVSPKTIPDEHKDFTAIFIHGGGYVFNGGKGCLPEAMAMAHYGQIKVTTMDYRLLPDYPFPAGLDDVFTVYSEVLKSNKPENVVVFGTSAGGALAASLMFKARDSGLPLPAAVGLGTPFADLSFEGDTYNTNEYIDNFLVSPHGLLKSIADIYAGSHDKKEPLISPLYGDFSKGFPPTILTSGTRDLFLSNTVRVHQKIREANIDAYLQVFEACSHAFYLQQLSSPESKMAYEQMVIFFKKYLGKKKSSI